MSAGLRTGPRLIRLRVRRPVVVILALVLVGLAALAPGRWGSTDRRSAATPTFSFGVAGDFGQTDSSTGAVLNAVKSSGASMMFGIGDFSYVAGSSEPSWCSYVKARVGSTYPFELLAGNHESYPRDGYYKNYDSCLPDRLSGVSGSYGQEYYVDYPAAAPLVRFVMISPEPAVRQQLGDGLVVQVRDGALHLDQERDRGRQGQGPVGGRGDARVLHLDGQLPLRGRQRHHEPHADREGRPAVPGPRPRLRPQQAADGGGLGLHVVPADQLQRRLRRRPGRDDLHQGQGHGRVRRSVRPART